MNLESAEPVEIDLLVAQLQKPGRLWTIGEVSVRPSPVPKLAGVYGWYFRAIPPNVPTAGCLRHMDFTLLYVGIAPSRLSSPRTLRKRLRDHCRGNAYGSTLRQSLGCLLSEKLGIHLQRVSDNRITFGPGEAALSAWMAENARVVWLPMQTPWVAEQALIQTLVLPLNLRENDRHPFHPILAKLRSDANVRARALSITRK